MVILSQDKTHILFPESGVVIGVGTYHDIIAYSLNTEKTMPSVLGNYDSKVDAQKAFDHIVSQIFNKREIVQTQQKFFV